MYWFSSSMPFLYFFLISYFLLLTPLVLFIKLNSHNAKLNFIDILVTKFFLNKTLLFFFFCLSGLPISNIFLLKWYCMVNISNFGNSIVLFIFFFVNICYLLFYFFFFQKIAYSGKVNKEFRFIKTNSYFFIMYIIASLFFNIFGFLLINFFFIIF